MNSETLAHEYLTNIFHFKINLHTAQSHIISKNFPNLHDLNKYDNEWHYMATTITDDKIPMTVFGKKLLDEELKHLLTVERPTIVKAIEVARGHGDLSENADYSAAKEKQSFIEGRIQEINGKLARAQVIDPNQIKTDKVVFGATVQLEEQDSSKKMTYQIVGVDEADIKNGKIGITSPIARALIGKMEGDEIIVHAPKGQIHYDVIKVSYD